MNRIGCIQCRDEGCSKCRPGMSRRRFFFFGALLVPAAKAVERIGSIAPVPTNVSVYTYIARTGGKSWVLLDRLDSVQRDDNWFRRVYLKDVKR